MDFIIEFIKESWPVFFCLYVVHQIEILDWLAEKIATAEYGFKPVHLKEYYLYKKNKKLTLTLIAPEEWKPKSPYGECIAKVRQLGDSTWEKL